MLKILISGAFWGIIREAKVTAHVDYFIVLNDNWGCTPVKMHFGHFENTLMVHGYFLDVFPCKISNSWLEKQLCYGQFTVIWFGMVWLGLVWFGLVWNGIVDEYCLDEVPCKIQSSWFEKQLSYGQYRNIWIGLVWLGQVWFSFEWYGTWVMSRCSLHAKF